ncbi:MAG TPA: hypothetical protein VGG42_08245 [Acidobacteriaceae bacterium]|jgi:hypothetical protein
MAALHSTASRLRSGWILPLAGAFFLLALSAHPQSAPNPRSAEVTASAIATDGFDDVAAGDSTRNHMLADMARQRNDLRQQAIVDDTKQLLELVQQLKTAVDKSSKDQVSLAVIHTAEQIQKLAKSVEKKMREAE